MQEDPQSAPPTRKAALPSAARSTTSERHQSQRILF